ncbi:MAG TPA: methyltransferase domain-containing protein [Thermoanaerobaculia bacterium]
MRSSFVTEPYFSVLTDPKYLRANLTPAAEVEFFETGEAYVARVFDVIRNRIAPGLRPQTALEVGCGPGRVAIPLSKRVPDVTAIDASAAMLTEAKRNAERLGAGRIRFAGDLQETQSAFDLINASLVFQHLSPAEGVTLLRQLVAKLNGVGVFHIPYRRHANAVVAASRWLRTHVPGVDVTVSVARGKGAPFLNPRIHDLDAVFAVLQDGGCHEPQVFFERHGDLDVAVLYVLKRSVMAVETKADEEARPSDFIDVQQLIASTSLEELNRTAEEYFGGLKEWEHHLAKPFNNADEAATILTNFATILQGLRLHPGLTVLEFGAGTGWLSRWLTQLGCRSILMDVSPSALKIARELYAKMPVIGERPEPRFLVYDGLRIDLPDASVDRIVCFDAFHHSPNPEHVLAEFARVLVPGGIAAFAEPGPQHSKTAQSQFEMRTYGVVENDVDIHALWKAARLAGFADLRLAAWNARPFHIRLDEYDDLLAGGETYARWANWSREFMNNVRDFFLYKGGELALDSRSSEGLSCAIRARLEGRTVHASITNTGRAQWLPSGQRPGGVSLGAHLYDEQGKLLDFDFLWIALPKTLAPGEAVEVSFDVEGHGILELDCVADGVAWFAQVRSTPARLVL